MNSTVEEVAKGHTPIITTATGAAVSSAMKYLDVINSFAGTLVIIATLVAGVITCLKYWAEKKKADAETERITIENEQIRIENHERNLQIEAAEIERRLEKSIMNLTDKYLQSIDEKKK